MSAAPGVCRRVGFESVRLACLATLLALVAVALPATASAHPLGNFTVNHLTQVKISQDRVELRYILDQAEIPTFQERDLGRAGVLAAKREEVLRNLSVRADGRPVALRPAGEATLTFPAGQGGLTTTRFELPLEGMVSLPVGRLDVRDGTFAGRVGWKSIVASPGDETAVRSSAPSGDPTGGLRRYPQQFLDSPLDRNTATLSARSGDGTLVAPANEGGTRETSRTAADGFAGLFQSAAAGEGVLAFLLAAALGWGALHALSPGHGKAMVAAYLVGTRGHARHAIALGVTVTLTHTVGVFALGLVTLALSQYLLPEDLYPWLTLASGLLVLIVGAGVLRARLRGARARGSAGHDHDHDGHDHGHAHAGDHHHHHGHSHVPPSGEGITWKGLIGMGASAGLIPCPSALVVLLGAVSQHEIALGMLLIVAFSVGLAATLTALGLAVVYARGLGTRLRVPVTVSSALPALSAVVIVAAGCLLTAQALPKVL